MTAKPESNSRVRSTPPWRRQEELVALLEGVIAPDALVVPDVQLQTIGSDLMRQCDVVIYAGEPPRQTITIVEVQKRAKKVGEHDLGGWLAKMEGVGAHGLLCVSEKGFTKPAQQLAARRGATVTLLTLGVRTTPDVLPSPIRVSESNFTVYARSIERVAPAGPVKLHGIGPSKRVPFSLAEPNISLDEEEDRHSVYRVIESVCNYHIMTQEPMLLARIDLGRLSRQLWIHLPEGRYRVAKWEFDLILRTRPEKFPVDVEHRAYQQHGLDDPIAWLTTVRWQEGEEVQELSIAARRAQDGSVAMLAHHDESRKPPLLDVHSILGDDESR